jgi:hypothetical protein
MDEGGVECASNHARDDLANKFPRQHAARKIKGSSKMTVFFEKPAKLGMVSA